MTNYPALLQGMSNAQKSIKKRGKPLPKNLKQ